MIWGCSATRSDIQSKAALACGVATCEAPASESRKPSMQTKMFGSSTLRDHSKNRLPSSAFTARAYSSAWRRNSSMRSGRTGNLMTIRITGPPWSIRVGPGVLRVALFRVPPRACEGWGEGGPSRLLVAASSGRRTVSQRVEPRAQQAERVALGVGQHVPALLAGLPDVGARGTQPEQPFQLGVLVAVGRVEVQVQPGLPGRGLGDGGEHQRRGGAAEAGLRADLHRAVLAAEHPVTQDLGPPRGQRLGVAGVDDDLAEPARHAATVGPDRRGGGAGAPGQ